MFFVILCSLLVATNSEPLDIHKLMISDAGGPDCKQSVRFLECSTGIRNIYQQKKHKWTLLVSLCGFPPGYLTYDYEVKGSEKIVGTETGPEFYMRPRKVKFERKYPQSIVIANVHGEKESRKFNQSTTCKFRAGFVKMQALITEGVFRTTGPGEITFDGTNSRDLDAGPNYDYRQYMNLKWTCRYLKTAKKVRSCQDVSGREFGSNKGKYKIKAVNDEEIFINLELISTISPLRSGQINHTVYVSNKAPSITATCRNCPSAVEQITKCDHRVEVSVNCKQRCPKSYEWTVEPTIDMSKKIVTTSTDHLKLERYAFPCGSTHVVKAKSSSGNAFAGALISTVPLLDQKCSISPATGEGLVTEFTVQCTSKQHQVAVIFIPTEFPVRLILSMADLPEHISFIAPSIPGAYKIITWSYDYGVSNVEKPATLTITEDNDEKKVTKIQEACQLVRWLMFYKYYELALNRVLVVLAEMKSIKARDEKSNKIVNDLRDEIFDKVTDVPQITCDMVDLMITAFRYLQEIYNNDTNNAMFEPIKNQCLRLSARINYLQKVEFDDTFAKSLYGYGSVSTRTYSEQCVKYQAPKLKPGTTTTRRTCVCRQTSEQPTLEIRTTTELPRLKDWYPDYMDPRLLPPLIQTELGMRTAVRNFGDSCKSKALAMIEDPADAPIYGYETCVTGVMKNGSEMNNVALDCPAVNLKVANDFKDPPYTNNEILAAMCTTKEVTLWYEPGIPIATEVVVVELIDIDKSKSVSNYTRPNIFKFKRNPDTDYLNLNETVGYTPFDDLQEGKEYTDYHISYHIIEVAAHSSFFVAFKYLEEDDFFDAVLIDSRIPVPSDFKNATHINIGSEVIDHPYVKNTDTYWFIGVLPNKKMTKPRPNNYTLVASYAQCVKWSDEKARWIFGCPGTYDVANDTIVCKCTHLSTLAGTITYNYMRFKEKTISPNIALEHGKLSYIILGTVFVTIFLFFIFCLWVEPETIPVAEIFLLCDVVQYHRFAYLMIVKTTNKTYSGTTANASFKIHGEKGSCTSHVLNYPDPYLTLLQRNQEDWFLIATEKFLGDLKNIELWTDGTGAFPEWHCEDILVCDLQSDIWYVFHVNKWFRMIHEGHVYVTAEEIYNRKIKLPRWESIWAKFEPQGLLYDFAKSFEDYHISGFKRISIVLASVLNIQLVCLLEYGVPKMNELDYVTPYYEYAFHVEIFVYGIIAACESFIVHTFFLWVSKNCKPQFTTYYNRNPKHIFPFFVNIIVWIFLIAEILMCSSFLVVYGLWVTYGPSLLWLTSVLFAILFYIYILDNFFSVVQNFVCPRSKRGIPMFDKIEAAIRSAEHQRIELHKRFGPFSLRPYLTHLYDPPTVEKKHWRTAMEGSQLQMYELLENVFLFLIYLVSLILIVLATRDTLMPYSDRNIRLLTRGSLSHTFKFQKIRSQNDFYKYMNKSFIPSIQPNDVERGLTIDWHNYLIGLVRIRQHRVKANSCSVPKKMRDFASRCTPEYEGHAETKGFNVYWAPNFTVTALDILNNAWRYTNGSEDGSSVTEIGGIAAYDAGGYTGYLGRNLENSARNLDYMSWFQWIDNGTRNLMLEFLLYNVNFNVFSSVTLRLEQSATGYILLKTDVQSTMLFVIDESRVSHHVYILFSFYVVVVILVIFITIKRVLRSRRFFFEDYWHLLDIALVILSFVCFILFIQRSFYVSIFFDELEAASRTRSHNYFFMFHLDSVFSVISSILVALATVKVWGVFRNGKNFRYIVRTFNYSVDPICCVLFFHFWLVLSYSVASYLLFSGKAMQFHKKAKSLLAVTQLAMHLLPESILVRLSEDTHNVGGIFFVFYTCCTILILRLYIVILIYYSHESIIFYSNKPKDYSFREYLYEKYLYFMAQLQIQLIKSRRKAGGVILDSFKTTTVIPKLDPHRYGSSCVLYKIKRNAMAYLTLPVLHKAKAKGAPPNDKHLRAMVDALINLNNYQTADVWGENDIFYAQRNVHTKKMEIIDDRRIEFEGEIVPKILKSQRSVFAKEQRLKKIKTMIDDIKIIMDEMNSFLTIIDTAINNIITVPRKLKKGKK